MVGTLIFLLTLAAVWQAETGHFFQYRGQARWTGPWDNPNTFGVLMAVGVVLSLGRAVQRLKAKGQMLNTESQGAATSGRGVPSGGEQRSANIEHRTSNVEHRTLNLGHWLRLVFLVAAAGVMGVGLVKSYSRGAWVGAAVGVAYLMYQIGKAESRKQKAEMGRGKAETLKAEMLKAVRSWLALAIISVAVGLLAFWSCRHTERAVARRAYSVANANDFSWRKRVAAYEGALQMMAERPWFGLGWNQPEHVYSAFYCPPKVDEAMAIQLNDYLMLGMTLGLPALLCFAVYVGRCLVRSGECGMRDEGRSPKSRVQSPKSGSDSLKSKVQSLRSEAESPKSQKESSVGAVQGPVEAGQMPEDGAAGAAAAAGPTLDFRLWTLDSATVCRAGALVLLVGFWFDGGLFKLATAAPFWILLELGRAND